MEDHLITIKTAKIAKSKGFDIKSIYYYDDKNILNIWRISTRNSNKFEKFYNAPTQSLLQKWLREIHKIQIDIIPNDTDYSLDVWKRTENCGEEDRNYKGYYKTYEEALEIGLVKALELI